MGLDSFWEHPDSDTTPGHLAFVPPLNLCGGMLSGNGAGSFRGKAYARLIEAATGVSLYRERISNEDIVAMAGALESYQPSRTTDDEIADAEADLPDLRRMFRAYGNAGFELRGWW